ncbi:glucosyltransferase domain-containing protein [Lapidilactobacillus gannanensis]|uniref:Glucosyltransferase domain-containing protein n=1 Tax=Lapidilactobacillus gannanensis TaxID=2486002 RepID=A0ABW4BPD5_9LACO
MIEQTIFTMQSAEVIIAVNMIIASAIIIKQVTYVHSLKTWFFFSLAIILNVLAFGTYSSLFVLFIVLTLMIIELDLFHLSDQITLKCYFFKILPYMLVFIMSYFIHSFLVWISKSLVGVSRNSQYFNSQIGIKNLGISAYIKHIYDGFINNFLTLHNKYFFWLLLLTFLISLVLVVIRKRPNLGWQLLTIFLIFIFSLTSFLILGKITPIRVLFPSVPIVAAFFTMFIMLNIRRNVFSNILFAAFVLVIFGQAKVTSDLCYSSELVFQDDVLLTHQLVGDLHAEGVKNINNYQLAVIGDYHETNPQILKGDVVGYSFYEWDHEMLRNSSRRVSGLWQSLGYSVQTVSKSDYLRLLEHVKLQGDNRRIFIYDDIIVIDLNSMYR